MLELPVITTGAGQIPTVLLDPSDDLADFHACYAALAISLVAKASMVGSHLAIIAWASVAAGPIEQGEVGFAIREGSPNRGPQAHPWRSAAASAR